MTKNILYIICFISTALSSCFISEKNIRIKNTNVESILIDSTKKWIKSNAKYPKSYTPVSFSKVNETYNFNSKKFIFYKFKKKVVNSERLIIFHNFYIADTANEMTLNYSKFIFDKNLKLLGFYYSIHSPKVEFDYYNAPYWKAKFGKKM